MENNNWRPIQGAEPSTETTDWRTQLQPDSRQRIVNKIMDTLKKHLPFSGQEGLHELKKIAERFEENIFGAAISQSDYLRKISLKMLTMETKSQTTIPNPLPPNQVGPSVRPQDPASLGIQSQVHNQGQSLPMPLQPNQSQNRQQLLYQYFQNNAGVQSSGGLSSSLPPSSSLTQTSIPNVVGQNPNMQNMQGTSQNLVGNSMGGVPSNMFANCQRQMQGRQQVIPQQQQQSSQNPQYLYQQQLQQQLLKLKFQQGNIPQSIKQSHMQQQQQHQQQNMLQPNQLQSSQQAVKQTSSATQPSMMQPSLSCLQQNKQSSVQQSAKSMLQQHPQAGMRQQQQSQLADAVHQQQTQMPQQQMLPQQQQQQLMGEQPNSTNMQQSHLLGQQNNVGDMQQQQQQRILNQQNNLPNLQQLQLMAQQNYLMNLHQQQLGNQSNVTGLQQQQMLGTQTGNLSMQPTQQPMHMLQQSKGTVQQQPQQSASDFLPTQSQSEPSQQQVLSQIQLQPTQMQQQLGLQQQPNPLQQEMPQRLQSTGQPSGCMLQPPNVMDQQKQQLYQPHRVLPESLSNSTAQTGHGNGGDWQEEVYQKIKAMKESYLPELNEMYQKIAAKLQQHDSLPHQPKSDQVDKLKLFKTMLERAITFLQVSKTSILPGHKDKLASYEKQIISFINTNRPRKPVSSLQQGQPPSSHMHSMRQSQSHENQMNPQLQSMNVQGSVTTMQQNNITNMQQNSMPALSGISTAQQSMMNSLQPSSNMDPGQGNSLNSLQQVAVGSLQQNPVSAPQQANMNALSSQNGVNVLQPNINSLQSNSGMLQHQQKQQILQSQHYKLQFHQQQLQAKQQIPGQMQTHQNQMAQLHQVNDVNDVKMRQGISVKPGVFQQHTSAGQRSAYAHQQMKAGSPFALTSHQLLRASSPQVLQHFSPQVDQQNLLPSLTKTGTLFQSANSPFVVPSPSTPLAPSPMPGDGEKPMSGSSSLSNAGNVGQQQMTDIVAPAHSLAIGTPGISASPLLAEFSGPDGTHGNALASVIGKSNITDQRLGHLIKAVSLMIFSVTMFALSLFLYIYISSLGGGE